jgi:lycopene beta-cyclase
MTNARFPFYQNGIYNIGTAGGQTKASTGYTFQFIQKQSRQIVELLSNNQPLQNIVAAPARFHFYDSVLLQLLTQKKLAVRRYLPGFSSEIKPQLSSNFSTMKPLCPKSWPLSALYRWEHLQRLQFSS